MASSRNTADGETTSFGNSVDSATLGVVSVSTSTPAQPTSTIIGWYPQGNSVRWLFQDQTGEGQSLLPTTSGSLTNPASASFSPSGTFGWNSGPWDQRPLETRSDVLVYTSARGYENPSVKYSKRETIQGVEYVRPYRREFDDLQWFQ